MQPEKVEEIFKLKSSLPSPSKVKQVTPSVGSIIDEVTLLEELAQRAGSHAVPASKLEFLGLEESLVRSLPPGASGSCVACESLRSENEGLKRRIQVLETRASADPATAVDHGHPTSPRTSALQSASLRLKSVTEALNKALYSSKKP